MVITSKKIVLLISGVLLTLCLITVVIFNNVDNKENNIISNMNKDKQLINSNMITMMYEIESGSGEYAETKDTTWPKSGYIFNENLSGCENGGELEYNSENNTVNLLSNSSDSCYVYFDKYDGVWVDNVVVTNVTGSSVILDVSATSENGSISTYYYRVNDSEEYQESTSNVITINDLNKLTEYKISIYAVDSTNAKSNIYEISVNTTDISIPIINSVSASSITDSSFMLTVNISSDVEIKRYYYSIDGGTIYESSSNNNYTFNNLDIDTIYNVSVFVRDINNNESAEYKIDVSTSNIPSSINKLCESGNNSDLFSCYIYNLYTSQGLNDLYYHTSNLANSAEDNSYRYSGANPNNYVCFGSNATPCPANNLYRIIGLFGTEIKLIKATTYGNNAFDSNNAWNANEKPLIRSTLNETFLDSFSSDWANTISVHTWEVGGIISNSEYNTKNFYDFEIGQHKNGVVDDMKVGLMYVSDYGYATNPSYWTLALSNYNNIEIINNNWLYSGANEWTISRNVNTTNTVYIILSSGEVTGDGYSANWNATRPCFYLKFNTLYKSGDGSQNNPFRIEL